jgi:hypothetical protein
MGGKDSFSDFFGLKKSQRTAAAAETEEFFHAELPKIWKKIPENSKFGKFFFNKIFTIKSMN